MTAPKTKLAVFPECPGDRSGYQIAVKADVDRLNLPRDDYEVFIYSGQSIAEGRIPPSFKLIPRPQRFALGRAWNLARCRIPSELRAFSIRSRIDRRPDIVFCGDTVLYRALKSIYPSTRFFVRFHNLFSRIRERRRTRCLQASAVERLNETLQCRIEHEILDDALAVPIAISRQDRDWMEENLAGRRVVYWPVVSELRRVAQVPVRSSRLIWFGSLSTHKLYSVKYFIEEVFAPLKRKRRELELHLFGAGTQRFHHPDRGIFGYGFYEGTGLPLGGDGLFVNPDLLGGGIKLKIATLFGSGANILTTEEGVEGYELPDDSGLFVAPMDSWEAIIDEFLPAKANIESRQ